MTNPSSPAITAVDVRKSFGDNVVLDGLDLTVEQGNVFALLWGGQDERRPADPDGSTGVVDELSDLDEIDRGLDAVQAGHPLAQLVREEAPRSVL